MGYSHSAVTTKDLVALSHVDNDRLRQFKNLHWWMAIERQNARPVRRHQASALYPNKRFRKGADKF
jgi:hypothetical protein